MLPLRLRMVIREIENVSASCGQAAPAINYNIDHSAGSRIPFRFAAPGSAPHQKQQQDDGCVI